MTITPTPLPDDERPSERSRIRQTYNWDAVVLGEWQRWLNLLENKGYTDDEAMRACTRIRVAATAHAKQAGLRVESRRVAKGRLLDLRFTRLDDPANSAWCTQLQPGGKCSLRAGHRGGHLFKPTT